jgi:hypothetical protein
MMMKLMMKMMITKTKTMNDKNGLR